MAATSPAHPHTRRRPAAALPSAAAHKSGKKRREDAAGIEVLLTSPAYTVREGSDAVLVILNPRNGQMHANDDDMRKLLGGEDAPTTSFPKLCKQTTLTIPRGKALQQGQKLQGKWKAHKIGYSLTWWAELPSRSS